MEYGIRSRSEYELRMLMYEALVTGASATYDAIQREMVRRWNLHVPQPTLLMEIPA